MPSDRALTRTALAGAGLAALMVAALMVAGRAGGAAVAQEPGPLFLDDLSPAAMMALYQAECAGGAGAGTVGEGAAAARVLGQRCDALARAIQGLSLDDRRAGSADLARPEFYTPGAR